MSSVLVLGWTEHERGWGQRPDGISLHASEEARKTYVADYWKRQPKETPNEYEAPDDRAIAHACDEATLALVEKRGGLRLWRGSYALANGAITLTNAQLLHEAQEAWAIALARDQAAELRQELPAGTPAPKHSL